MGRYTSQTISGYNATPPADDGSEVATNQVKWATHKTKLADPVKTLAEAVNSELSSFDGRIYPSGVTTTATSLTLTKATHDGKNIRCSGNSTITLPEAASATATFRSVITKTDVSNTITVDTQNSETIDGASSVTLTTLGESIGVVTDGTNWFIDARYLATQPLPQGYLDGLEVTINSSDTQHDVDIAVGVARDAGDAANIDLASVLVKKIDVDWVAGTDAGGFPSALTLSASTRYYVFVIVDSDGTVDGGYDTSSTATNLLTDASTYVGYREVGQAVTDATSNIDQIYVREGKTGTGSPLSTASGTAATFLSIPSWVTEITVSLVAVSLSGTDSVLLQFGDSGGFETTGYLGSSGSAASSTSGFTLSSATAAEIHHGSVTLRLMEPDSNIWLVAGVIGRTNTGGFAIGGSKTLSAALDRLRLVPSGSDTFDGGTVNIYYR